MPDLSTVNPTTLLLGVYIPAGFVVLAFLFILVGFVANTKMNKFRAWRAVSGKVLESDISKGSDERFTLNIRYAYEVSGERWESDRFSAGQANPSFREIAAQKRLASYPVGQTILVFYNPEHPNEAFLEAPSLSKYFFVLAAVMIAAALLFALNTWVLELVVSG
ncbi:MAG: DUF3592 domain-containing protein [Anaerolineae bacterium]